MSKYEQDQMDSLINFEDSYNEQQFLKSQKFNGSQQSQNDKKNGKLSIMGDFNDLCKKLAKDNQGFVQSQSGISKGQGNNFVTQYYAKLKQNQGAQRKSTVGLDKQNSVSPPQIKQKKINMLKCPDQVSRKSVQNCYKIPSLALSNLSKQNDKNSPLYVQKPLNIKKSQNIQSNEGGRNYYSVEDKKKVVSTNKPNQFQRVQQAMNNPIKDYYGEENNFVNRKIHGKNFLTSKDKQSKKNQMQNENKKDITLKIKNQNNIKQANIIQSQLTTFNQKTKQNQLFEKPKIIIYTKVIDLTQSTQSIIEAFKKQQMKSDYEMHDDSQNAIEEGLFAKAIVNQRATKTVQNVQSSSASSYYLEAQKKDTQRQQYASSPINSNYMQKPASTGSNSIFQKKQSYIR